MLFYVMNTQIWFISYICAIYNVMEKCTELLALCAENPLVISDSPHKGPVIWSFDDFFC